MKTKDILNSFGKQDKKQIKVDQQVQDELLTIIGNSNTSVVRAIFQPELATTLYTIGILFLLQMKAEHRSEKNSRIFSIWNHKLPMIGSFYSNIQLPNCKFLRIKTKIVLINLPFEMAWMYNWSKGCK